MTFDDQLRDLADTLAERLRREAAGHLQDAVSNLQETHKAERDAAVADAARDARERAEKEAAERFAAAVAEAVREARVAAEREAEGRLSSAIADAKARSYEAGVDEGRKEGLEHGKDQGREEGRLHGLEQGRLEGRTAGLEEGFKQGREAAMAESQTVEHEAPPATIERLAGAMRVLDESRSLSEILSALADAAHHEAASAAVLLVRGDGLRSWRLKGFGQALDEAAPFDLPLSDAGLLAEAVRSGRTVQATSAEESSVPGFVTLSAGRPMFAAPVRLSGDVVAVLYGDQGEQGAQEATWQTALEILARHGARALEAVTAFRAASLLAGGGGGDVPGRVGAVAEDAVAARRYARLLISEIKLYHESDVAAGRREKDLVTRLGGEIARARALYDERVPTQRGGAADHFRAELVSTLANGDASLLGDR